MIPAGYQPKNGKQQEFKPEPARMLKMMQAMGKFNDEVKKAFGLIGIDGLAPLAKGARLAFAGGKPTVTDGPAIEPKEVVGGYWLVDAKSKQEVVDLWKRCPAEDGDVIEIRAIADMSDFPTEVRDALLKQGAHSTGSGQAGSKEAGAARMRTRPPHSTTRPPHSTTRAPHSGTGGPWKKRKGGVTKDQD